MMKSPKIEPLRLSSKVKEELCSSGVFTAAGANAILQKVVMESESTGALSRSDLTASNNSINILGDNEEQATPTIEKSVMGKLNASFSSFFLSSIESLKDELDSPNLSEVHSHSKERNIAPRAIRTDMKSHKFREVKW